MDEATIFEDGHYFIPLTMNCIRLCPRTTTAVFLAYLHRQRQAWINYYKHRNHGEAPKTNSFHQSNEEVMRDTGLSRHELLTAKAEIQELGIFTTTRTKSVNGCTTYTYNHDIQLKLLQELKDAETPFSDQKRGSPESGHPTNGSVGSPESGHPDVRKADIPYNSEITNKITLSPAHSGMATGGDSFKMRKWERMAVKLYTALLFKKKIPDLTPTRKRAWAVELSKLEKTYDLDHIQEVLLWYCESLRTGNLHMVPESECGRAFREDFGRMENAITRREREEARADGEDRDPESSNGHANGFNEPDPIIVVKQSTPDSIRQTKTEEIEEDIAYNRVRERNHKNSLVLNGVKR